MIPLVLSKAESGKRVKMLEEDDLIALEKEGKVKRINKKLYVAVDNKVLDKEVEDTTAAYSRKDMVAEKPPRKAESKPRSKTTRRKKA